MQLVVFGVVLCLNMQSTWNVLITLNDYKIGILCPILIAKGSMICLKSQRTGYACW